MNELEIKRKKIEISRVEMARKELEFKIDEREDEIGRLKSLIKIQIDAEDRLKKEINELIQKKEVLDV